MCLAQQTPQPVRTAPPVSTSINVTDTIEQDSPSVVTVLTQQQIQRDPGIDLDDRLRLVPGFQLFRRASSIVANPTTQGLSLRGLGSSGASRTLVLWDGIPVNDPFGGWVYWTRLAPEEMQRVELTPSASTAIFGDRAMDGLVAMFSRAARGDSYLQYDHGSFAQQEVLTGMSDAGRHWAGTADVRLFTTTGYYVVPGDLRGSVDQPAGVDYVAGNARADYFKDNQRLFLRLDILAEHRNNGTADQRNSTGLGTVAGNYALTLSPSSQLSVLAYYTQEAFRATFSSVAPGRDSERITDRQTVPADGGGGAIFWTYARKRFKTVLGGNVERDDGFSTDRLLSGTQVNGGHQIDRGGFAQLQINAGPVSLFGGLRGDVPDTTGSIMSPSGGFAFGHKRVRVRGSVWRSFRLPTLNELYRPFQVGNVLTEANPDLLPERLFGSEVGVDLIGERTHATLTLFRDALDNLIGNATLSSTGNTILRQRQNGVPAVSRGIEANVGRTWRNWQGQLGYLFVDSRYDNGLRIPEVAKNQGSAQLGYSKRDLLISASLRSYSSQFDDDVNHFLLPGFASFAASARDRISKNMWAIAEIENIFDRQYYVSLTPLPVTGTPRFWRLGLRWEQR